MQAKCVAVDGARTQEMHPTHLNFTGLCLFESSLACPKMGFHAGLGKSELEGQGQRLI